MAPDFSRHYTRAGDDGFTGLIGRGRVPKYDLHPDAYGEVDELQAVLGMCRAAPVSRRANDLLVVVERDLHTLMGELATPAGSERMSQPRIGPERIEWLEAATDEIGAELPPLTDFLVPGDTSNGALLNLARTVARRAERAVARLVHHQTVQGQRDSQTLAYLNRLSSLLFVLTRSEDLNAGVDRPTLARS
jgi:cob(I)alamin adenosyltransferase